MSSLIPPALMMRAVSLLAVLVAMPAYTYAATDIIADTLSRDAKGVITAEGDVQVNRDDQILTAPHVVYDVKQDAMQATGGVQVQGKDRHLTAQQLKRDNQGIVTATGDVRIRDKAQSLHAPKVIYNEAKDSIHASGGVELLDTNRRLTAESAKRNADGVITATGDVTVQDDSKTLMADQVVYDEKNKYMRADGHVAINHKDIELTADSAQQHGEEQLQATGHVQLMRQQEVMDADKASYDQKSKILTAEGHVHLQSPKAEIDARKVRMHTVNPTAELSDAHIRLPGGERIQATTMQRLDEHTFQGKNISFSTCPIDDEAWRVYAEEASIDQEQGKFIARHARFEMAGIPVLYTPYWQHPLRRSSGLMIPFYGTSKARGSEFALPYYVAPAKNWDATLTPRWMTARGLMGEVELRHASSLGKETIDWAQIRDKQTDTNRYRIKSNIQYRLPANWTFTGRANHVGDHQYLADLVADRSEAKVAFLQTDGDFAWRSGENYASLLVRNNQNLRLTNDKTTLQILPRLETGVALPLSFADLHLQQQTTGFDRKLGLDGWRLAVHPWLEREFEWMDGAISTTLSGGMRHVRYWQLNTALSRQNYNIYDASIETRFAFEKISEARIWRHAITPIVRYDIATAPDQRALPNFDSGFGRLSLQNLLSGNRFSGYDRFERMNRVSFMLENALQYKGEDEQAKPLLVSRVGVAYDILRTSIDPVLSPTVNRPFSNVLGDMTITPIRGVRLAVAGQYDPVANFWGTANAALGLSHDAGHHLNVRWQRTDARYAAATETIQADMAVQFAARWQALGSIQYDAIDKLTQQASAGVHYQHACWEFTAKGYRTHLSGTAGTSDVGFTFLLGFKGLGSVGN